MLSFKLLDRIIEILFGFREIIRVKIQKPQRSKNLSTFPLLTFTTIIRNHLFENQAPSKQNADLTSFTTIIRAHLFEFLHCQLSSVQLGLSFFTNSRICFTPFPRN